MELKRRKNEKVFILKLYLVSPERKEMKMNLNFQIGVFHRRGSGVRRWIETEINCTSIGAQPRSTSTTTIESPIEPTIEPANNKERASHLQVNTDDNQKEIANIWTEI